MHVLPQNKKDLNCNKLIGRWAWVAFRYRLLFLVRADATRQASPLRRVQEPFL